MERSGIEFRDKLGGIEAELRSDWAAGDSGYAISVMGWGDTAEIALANLRKAVAKMPGEAHVFGNAANVEQKGDYPFDKPSR